MTINLKIPQKFNIKPTITVFGVGGAGGNAVNNMVSSDLDGVNFVVGNTDAQSLDNSLTEHRIQLGETITQGLGAGSYPEVGKAAAEEAAETIIDALQDSNMVFITAGMGGGTGTGAAPVIARLAREQGVLTVAVVTKPFHFEGSHRMRVAELGIQELQKYVDTLVVIPNQNLFRIADKSTTFADAFKMADEVLSAGIRGITDLMVMPGLINLDFADIRSVMSEMGKAMMGAGEASGETRAGEAAEAAISNPLLDHVSMKGAKGVLINITGGPDLTLFEVDEAANRIREEVDPDANIIFGSTFDEKLQGKIRVSIVATGIDSAADSNVTKLFSSTDATGKSRKFAAANPLESSASSDSEYAGDESDKGDENTFIAPDPVEVEDSAEEEGSNAKNDNSEGLSSGGQRPFITKAKPKGLGLFARFSSKPQEEEEAPISQRVASADEENESEERESTINVRVRPSEAPRSGGKAEDFLDIPAFLRKKTK